VSGNTAQALHEKQTGKGHVATKSKQDGAGKPSYRAFVATEMRQKGGNLKGAAAK
jgi:hypothetical protein